MTAAPAKAISKRPPAKGHAWKDSGLILGAHQRDLWAEHPRRQPGDRSHFSFMSVYHDDKSHMDCPSPYAMTRLLGLKGQYQLAFAYDPDAIVAEA